LEGEGDRQASICFMALRSSRFPDGMASARLAFLHYNTESAWIGEKRGGLMLCQYYATIRFNIGLQSVGSH
ncbi:MAG: hypothetical protein IIT51_04190, partial [Oscillospiraceae bacterium]|nr:hypothetical protein [Oscillospiraceae bacterium]